MIGTSTQAPASGLHPVVELLLTLAAAADRALDDSEECQGDDGERVHMLDAFGMDAMSDALEALGDLPDDQPGFTMGPAAKARWALRDDLARAMLLGQQSHARGLEAAAKWVDARRQAFDDEHGHTDPSTGTFEYGTGPHAEAKIEYSAELFEIAEGIRALIAPAATHDAAAARPVAWRFPKAGINNGYHYVESLNGEEERFKHHWEPVFAAPPAAVAAEPVALTDAQRKDMLAAALYLSGDEGETVLTSTDAVRIVKTLCDVGNLDEIVSGALAAAPSAAPAIEGKPLFRTTQVLVDSTWIKREFEQLQPGDIFRLFEPDGTLVVGSEGSQVAGFTEFRASSQPTDCGPSGVGIISVDEMYRSEIPELDDTSIETSEAEAREVKS